MQTRRLVAALGWGASIDTAVRLRSASGISWRADRSITQRAVLRRCRQLRTSAVRDICSLRDHKLYCGAFRS